MAVAAWLLFCFGVAVFGFIFVFLTLRHHYLVRKKMSERALEKWSGEDHP